MEHAAEDLSAAWHTVPLLSYIDRLRKFDMEEKPDTVWTRISVKVRDVIRLIESESWKHVRTTGSHSHFKHASKSNIVTIPGHPGDDIPTGTLKSILKGASLEEKK